jgi:hypothetical protein
MNDLPKCGDVYVCDNCGMQLECTVDCGCDESDKDCFPVLQCCGKPLTKGSKP